MKNQSHFNNQDLWTKIIQIFLNRWMNFSTMEIDKIPLEWTSMGRTKKLDSLIITK